MPKGGEKLRKRPKNFNMNSMKNGDAKRKIRNHVFTVDNAATFFRTCPQRSNIRDQSFSQALKETRKQEDDEVQKLLAEENAEHENQTRSVFSQLDLLTGKPIAQDEIEYCVPVCGPYDAIKDYKYKVKVTPGSTKRGKAIQTSLHLFQRHQEQTKPELDMIRAIQDTEAIAAILSNVKVSAPGMTATKGRSKGQFKKSKGRQRKKAVDPKKQKTEKVEKGKAKEKGIEYS
eukprot:TRINITY_DN3535_c0_g1_i1.p1 TRINITY_DN3535_c0_g1~~TRINITY_DN3535_c0_g1_i1.p1  ORF type:complete len:231 (-),score=51.29 TRINITY_DN3535_c0_g1_i1:95-787(-)